MVHTRSTASHASKRLSRSLGARPLRATSVGKIRTHSPTYQMGSPDRTFSLPPLAVLPRHAPDTTQPPLGPVPPLGAPRPQDKALPEVSVQTSPLVTPLAEVLGIVNTLMTEVHRLKDNVSHLTESVSTLEAARITAEAAQASLTAECDGLRTALCTLETIVMDKADQEADEAVSREEAQKKKTSSKKKSKTTPQSSPDDHLVSDESSDEENISEGEPTPADAPIVPSGSLGPSVPGLVEQETRREEFSELVSYRFYRLHNRSHTMSAKVSGDINAQLKRLKHHIEGKFSGESAIKVLDFLSSFKKAADQNSISEASAGLLLPYFLDGRAKSGLQSRLKQVPRSTPTYPAAVNWLLQSFATETAISAACQRVMTAKQTSEEDEEQFATRVLKYSADAGNVFSENTLITVYLDGLLPFAANIVGAQVTKDMTFTQVQNLAVRAGRAARTLVPRGASKIPGSTNPSGRIRPTIAASTEVDTRELFPPSEVVAAAIAHSDLDREDTGSSLSFQSSVSVPSRGWSSVAGTPMGEPIHAVERRYLSCHLCYDPSHLIADCPLLGPEVQKIAQNKRDERVAARTRPPTPKEAQPVAPSGSPLPVYPRKIFPRPPGPRRPQVLAVEEVDESEECPPPSAIEPAEN